jgi:hypothetical protein
MWPGSRDWVRVDSDHQVSLIGFRLCTLSPGNLPPAFSLSLGTCEPARLSIREQLLAMFGGTKKIDTHSLCRCRHKGATVCVLIRTFVIAPSVGFSSLPVHMLMCEPKRFHVHCVKLFGKPLACRGDFTAAGFGGRVAFNCDAAKMPALSTSTPRAVRSLFIRFTPPIRF